MSKRRIPYRINLPDSINTEVKGLEVKLSGVSVAYTPTQAVSQYLMRENKQLGKIAMNYLKSLEGGLSRFASPCNQRKRDSKPKLKNRGSLYNRSRQLSLFSDEDLRDSPGYHEEH